MLYIHNILIGFKTHSFLNSMQSGFLPKTTVKLSMFKVIYGFHVTKTNNQHPILSLTHKQLFT